MSHPTSCGASSGLSPEEVVKIREAHGLTHERRALSREKALPSLCSDGNHSSQDQRTRDVLETFRYDKLLKKFETLSRVLLEDRCIDLKVSGITLLSPNPVVTVLYAHVVVIFDALCGSLIHRVDVTWRSASTTLGAQRRIFMEAGRLFLCSEADVAVTAVNFQPPFSNCNISHPAGARYRSLKRENASIKNVFGFDINETTHIALVSYSSETSGMDLLWCTQDRATGHLEILWEASFLTPAFETHIMSASTSLVRNAAAVVCVTSKKFEVLGPCGLLWSLPLPVDSIPRGYVLSCASLCTSGIQSDSPNLLMCWSPGNLLGAEAVGAQPVFVVARGLRRSIVVTKLLSRGTSPLRFRTKSSSGKPIRNNFHYVPIVDSISPLQVVDEVDANSDTMQYSCVLLVHNSIFKSSELISLSSHYHEDILADDSFIDSMGPEELLNRCHDSVVISHPKKGILKRKDSFLLDFHCLTNRSRHDGGPSGAQLHSCTKGVPIVIDRDISGIKLDVGDVADVELFVAEDESTPSSGILAILTSRSLHRSSPLICTSDSQGNWLDIELLEDFGGISNETTTMLQKSGRNLVIQVTESSVAIINVTSRCRSGVKFIPEQLKITASIAASASCRGIYVSSKLTQRASHYIGIFIASRSSLRALLVLEGWESGTMQRDDARILACEFDAEISCLSAIATQSDEKLHNAQIKVTNNLIVVGTWASNDIEIACISEYGDQILRISRIQGFLVGDSSIKQIALLTPERFENKESGALSIAYPIVTFFTSGNVTILTLSFRSSAMSENDYDTNCFGMEVIANMSIQNGMKLVQIIEATGLSKSFLIIRDESIEFVNLNYRSTEKSKPLFDPTLTRLVINNIHSGCDAYLCLNATNGSIESESGTILAIAACWIHRSSLNDKEELSIARGKFSGSPTYLSNASLWIPGSVLKCHRLAEMTNYGLVGSSPLRQGGLLLYEWTDASHVYATVTNKALDMHATMGGSTVYRATDSLGAVLRTFAVPLIGDNFEALHSGTPIGICFAKKLTQIETYAITVATYLIRPDLNYYESLSNQIIQSGFCTFEINVPKYVELLRWSDVCVSSFSSTSQSVTLEAEDESPNAIIALASYGSLVLVERPRLSMHPPSAAEQRKGLHIVAKSDLVSEATPVLDLAVHKTQIFVSVALVGIQIFEYRPSKTSLQSTHLVALGPNMLLTSLTISPGICCLPKDIESHPRDIQIFGRNIVNRELCGIALRFVDDDDPPSATPSTSNSYVAQIVPFPERLRPVSVDPRLACEEIASGPDHSDYFIRSIADVYRM